MAVAAGDRNGQAAIFDAIGRVYDDLADKQKALDYYNKALPLLRAVGDRSNEANTLNNIGAVYASLDENQKALDHFGEALALDRSVGNHSGEAGTLDNIASVYSSLGQKEKALDYYGRALLVAQAAGDLKTEGITLKHLMTTYDALGNSRTATFYGKRAVNAYQQLRSNLLRLDKEIQQTYLRSIELTYRDLTDLLIRQNRVGEAQQVLNAFKDQQFFDFDQKQANRPTAIALTPSEIEFGGRYDHASSNLGVIGTQVDNFKRTLANRKPDDEEARQLSELERQLESAGNESSRLLKSVEAEFSQRTLQRFAHNSG